MKSCRQCCWKRRLIFNTRPLTHYFHEELEDCLSPNHILFGMALKLFDLDQGINEIIPSKNLQHHKSFLGQLEKGVLG